MPVYALSPELMFPHPGLASRSGLLAVGGDLSAARLLLAYSLGIFPWYNEGDPILWWSPSPRLIIVPKSIHVPRSLIKSMKREHFSVTFDTAFGDVIKACATTGDRAGEGTWLVPEMIAAYENLHRLGYAHSVETWQDGRLAGGLYGVSLGRCFFGESMFFSKPDASKTALVTLAAFLASRNFSFIDCQQDTPHMRKMGGRTVSRRHFMQMLREAMDTETLLVNWGELVV
ncbi:MAG: leucyl/phenylalanyl-tRNA--protein transferase [Deltaproteobacteria bacterium]|nr:leucyl/phenylalanyl-tRNA--protein transferase [Deltaproteobacteria bacterium]